MELSGKIGGRRPSPLQVLIDDQHETIPFLPPSPHPRFRQPWVLGGVFALLSAGAGGLLVFVLHRAGFVRGKAKNLKNRIAQYRQLKGLTALSSAWWPRQSRLSTRRSSPSGSLVC